jgi:microsomal dipeptidase-like Zn-dependent dipeptidase
MRRLRGKQWLWRPVAAALALAAIPAAASAAETPTRYSLANGCYTLTGPDGRAVGGADRVRMQATALGRYLLYRPDRTFVAAHDDGSVSPADAPSRAADWRVAEAGDGTFTLSPMSAEGRVLTAGAGGAGALADPATAGDAAHLRFVPADGCGVFPEAALDATGRPAAADLSYGRVGGLVEGHMHWMTYDYLGGRFHCGRPWHPYGIPSALPDCSSIEGPNGVAAPFQNFLNYGNPAQPHDTTGYPKLTEWKASNLTYEGTYWRWIERAWLGGLRLMVMSINENRVLCQLQANRETNCDEMDTVRRGFRAIHQLQDYVDAQAGGPGKGFFEIVTDPYQARRVINEGRMAVVLEIEVSEPFGCTGWDHPTCDQAQVDRQLDEMHQLGVRSMLLLNKFDNPLVGARFDSGPVGVIINAGNRESAGSYWSAQTCIGPFADNTIFTGEPQSSALVDSALGAAGVPSGAAPAYPPAPHCNTRGLTALGRHVVERMMDLHMIVNPDHMSQAGVDETLSLLEARRYSGVISPHGWMDPGDWPRLWKLGGMAFPGHADAAEYVKEWQRYRPQETPYLFGWGYGADLGGLAQQPAPASDRTSLTYPFKSYDGRVTFDRQRTGDRTFDYTKEGVAHYGLYADWFADLRRIGGQPLADDLWNGAEAYLEMWERADGVPAPGCASADGRLTSRGLGPLRLGVDWQALLRRAGQPQQRTRVWTWCVRGARNQRAADVAELDRSGHVELVGSTARGDTAAGVGVGASAGALRGTRPGGGSLRLRGTRRGTWVYAVQRGRVTAVAVASRSLARRPHALRAAVRRLQAATATQAPRAFHSNLVQAGAAGRPTGRTLAGTGNPRLNAALALLCSLQMQGASPGGPIAFSVPQARAGAAGPRARSG